MEEPCVSPLEWEAEVTSLHTGETPRSARPLLPVRVAARELGWVGPVAPLHRQEDRGSELKQDSGCPGA